MHCFRAYLTVNHGGGVYESYTRCGDSSGNEGGTKRAVGVANLKLVTFFAVTP